MINESHVGGKLDDFLKDEGIYEDVRALAAKKLLAFQLRQAMKEKGISKTEMAKRMKSSRSSLNRLLDPASPSVNLATVARAASALGKQLELRLV